MAQYSSTYSRIVHLFKPLLDVTEMMIGDVGYDSRQNPAPAIGTNWGKLVLLQFVLFVNEPTEKEVGRAVHAGGGPARRSGDSFVPSYPLAVL